MYKQIVVGTDGSGGATVAVDTAIELARLTGAGLHVVYAHKLATPLQMTAAAEAGFAAAVLAESDDAVHAEGQRVCDLVVERAGNAGVKAEGHCISADPADALGKVAEDVGADLIVVGNRGMTGARRVLGSVPNKLSHHCPTSLLIADTSGARS
jgi:nucleotide-binding universal stress UspA family protein